LWFDPGMAVARDDLPDDVDALETALLAERDGAARVGAELAVAWAKASDDQALIAHQQLQIAKLTRELYGQHSERSARLVDQMELAFEELESSATEVRSILDNKLDRQAAHQPPADAVPVLHPNIRGPRYYH
jgi:hypothetical protein